jgi:hypothetical protein
MEKTNMTESAEIATTGIIAAAQQSILDEHADAIRKYAKRAVDDVLEIGRRLAEAKTILGHGNWLPWLEREFGWSEDTAERLIAIYKLQRQIPQVRNLDLPLSGLYLLGRRTTPPEAIEAVVAKAQDGERVSVAEVKATIQEAKHNSDPGRNPKASIKLAIRKSWSPEEIALRERAARLGYCTKKSRFGEFALVNSNGLAHSTNSIKFLGPLLDRLEAKAADAAVNDTDASAKAIRIAAGRGTTCDDYAPRPRRRPPVEIITPDMSAQLVALAHKHLDAIVSLMRKMSSHARVSFQQEAMERLAG